MAENEFLNGIRLDQFMQNSNDQLKDTMGDMSKNMSSSISSVLTNQKTQIRSLKSIDKTSKSINKGINSILKNQEKMIKIMGGRGSSGGGVANAAGGMASLLTGFKKIFNDAEKKKNGKTDKFKRKNYDEDTSDKLGNIGKSLKGIAKRSGGGLLMGVGASFAGAGLIGYLLTGNKDLLGNLAKGANYMLKGFTGIFNIGKMFGKGFGAIGKMFGLKTASSAGKAMSKAGAKGAAKKIPVLGAIIGLALGINKFRKGDIVGGLLEIASGTVSIIPGIGTMASIMIDLYSLRRDLTMTPAKKKAENTQMTGFWSSKETMKKIPGIGAIVWFQEGMDLWDTDKKASLKAFGMSGIGAIFPGLGVVQGMYEGISGAFSMGKQKKKNKVGDKKMSTNLTYAKNLKGLSDTKQKSWLKMYKANPKQYKTIDQRNSGLQKFMQDGGDKWEADALGHGKYTVMGIPGSGIPSMVADAPNDRIHDATNSYVLHPTWNPQLDGVRDDVWNNFMGMTTEFTALTGERAQINSAFRDPKKQWELWDQYQIDTASGKDPSPVAYPGESMHEYGYALDINSPEMNKMASMGLMSKWNFHRPVGSPGQKGYEPWHIEPTGLEYKKIQSGVGMAPDSPGQAPMGKQADGLTPRKVSSAGIGAGRKSNTPTGSVARKVNDNDPVSVKLTSSDIEALAVAFGKQLTKMKQPSTTTLSANTGSPRSNL